MQYSGIVFKMFQENLKRVVIVKFLNKVKHLFRRKKKIYVYKFPEDATLIKEYTLIAFVI